MGRLRCRLRREALQTRYLHSAYDRRATLVCGNSLLIALAGRKPAS